MAHHESHPLFLKDEALIHEFNTWYVQSAKTLQNIPRKREMLEYLDNANALARNVKQQIVGELAEVDKNKGLTDASKLTKRNWIMGRYATINDRLWDRRSQIGTQLDTMLSRQDSKAEPIRDRMPAHIIALPRHRSNSRKPPAPSIV
jgi:hypothetical protein